MLVRTLLLLSLCLPVFGAGTVTQSLDKLGSTGNFVLTVSWTGDETTGAVPATVLLRNGRELGSTDGYIIYRVETDPGSPAPTALYDITITNGAGLDLMGGALANRSATVTEAAFPAGAATIDGSLTFTITNQNVAAAQGTVLIYLAPSNSGNAVTGGSALTTANTIPKVTAAGTLGESAISDDGTTVTVTGRNVVIGTTVHDAATSESACDASKRGHIVRVNGGAGVADTYRQCIKSAADTYAWSAFGGGSDESPYSCAIDNDTSTDCTHNLGNSTPWVGCYDSSGNMLGGATSATSLTDVVVLSANAVRLTFSGAEAGRSCVISTGSMGPKGDTGDTGATGPAGSSLHSFGATFDGGGSALTAGKTVYATLRFACTVNAWDIMVDQGTATVDVWKVATGTAIPVEGDKITGAGAGRPAISSGTAIHSTTLTGWSTADIATNDIVAIHLEAVASATMVSAQVQCQ